MVPVPGTYVEGGSAVVGAVWPPRFWLPCGGEPRGSPEVRLLTASRVHSSKGTMMTNYAKASSPSWAACRRPWLLRVSVLAALAMFMPHPVAAQTTAYQTLYSFQGSPDGADPTAAVIIGKNGALYGTTTRVARPRSARPLCWPNRRESLGRKRCSIVLGPMEVTPGRRWSLAARERFTAP